MAGQALRIITLASLVRSVTTPKTAEELGALKKQSDAVLQSQLPLQARHTRAQLVGVLESAGAEVGRVARAGGVVRMMEAYSALSNSTDRPSGELLELHAELDGAITAVNSDLSQFCRENRGLPTVPLVNALLGTAHRALISTRVMTQQHTKLMEAHVGDSEVCVAGTHDILEICKDTVHSARAFCVEKNGESPEAEAVVDPRWRGVDDGNAAITGVVVPAHVHFIVMELLKNSMKAVLDNWDIDLPDAPPIEVLVSQSNTEIGIEVRDSGGGIPPRHREAAWDYLHTSVPCVEPTYTYSGGFGAPFTGAGVGLPLVREYARWYNGAASCSTGPGGSSFAITLNKRGFTRG